MMAKKAWETAIGEQSVNPMDSDELLAQTKSNSARNRIKRQEDEEDAAHEARMARLAKEKAASEAAVEKTGAAPASPFEVKGSVNLGTIDFQRQQEELKTSIATIQETYEKQIKDLKEGTEHYREKVAELQLASMNTIMQARIDSLQKALEANQIRPQEKGFAEQLAEINSMADVLGFRRVSPDENTPAELKLKIMQMEMEEKARDRDFQRQMKADDRNWQLKLEEIRLNTQTAIAKVAADREKTDLFANAPKILGQYIGKAMMEANGGAQPAPAPGPVSRKKSAYHIEANEGDTGDTDCPECGGKVAIAPTSRSAVCPGCNTRISITRIGRRGEEEEE